ncbi:VanZ family protein [Alkaliphilus metalliredigens QYMF]|uniref:VanZ family protein n=1 Tax=Alkaliphilus metalliredigens (strain QYMF) TaxID=293826 RepID=A6TKG3_ALKMQ|nr:VanZ family protein [Alkaliphilus metalliredigens]ABR46681.1 VanZ family protein [Alkaliphilus metalliredigens QYMF]
MFKNKKIIVISWIAVLLWMGLIFYLSAQPATQSREVSEGVTEIFMQTVERVAPDVAAELDIRMLNYLIRKNAHFFAYLTLGVLVLNGMRRSGVSGIRGIVIAFFICVLYAISDEVHQLYVPGRSGELRDVLIDSAGAMVGIGLYLGLGKIKKKVMISRV